MNLLDRATSTEIADALTKALSEYTPTSLPASDALSALEVLKNSLQRVVDSGSMTYYEQHWGGVVPKLTVQVTTAYRPEQVAKTLAQCTAVLLTITQRNVHLLSEDELRLFAGVNEALSRISFLTTWKG